MADAHGRAPSGRGVLLDASAVAAAWGGLLLAENVALGFLRREQFSGAWEISLARHTAVPMTFAALAPLSVLAVAGWRAAERAADGWRPAVWTLGVAGAMVAGAIAVGVSAGRHFASWALRGPFVLAFFVAGGVLTMRVAPRLTALSARPVALAALGLAFTAVTWLGNLYVLPRLYPAFHAAMLAGSLLGTAMVGLAFRLGASPTPAARVVATGIALAAAACAAWTPTAIRRLDRAANLRMALVEQAPLLGAAVVAEIRLRRSAANSSLDEGAAVSPVAPGEVARSLDWVGRDLVLLSVDALRADHVTSYGYSRATTPSIDALAREGMLFENAYCPTPHTSYSVTSMLTGKYMKPLLALGLGDDSETWPQALRRYGWRTAAFYPPAVFFIDGERFKRLEEEHLGFEYAKVEFADPVLREAQVSEYLDGTPGEAPLFLWVHFFEPHEPYVMHPQHVFSGGPSADVDAYDSEIATADEGIGRIARVVRERRPGAVIIVTADHGEEFGEHGGHHHGTSVYEEQVRVPLVVLGPGVRRGSRVATVVQTIDLFPTVLSAVAIPRPARVRGRDLGPALVGDPRAAAEGGFAFAEAGDYELVAAGTDRLVCDRRAAACAMYRPKRDPLERSDVAGDDPARFEALRAMLRALEVEHGRFEARGGQTWPEALRRGLQGEVDAAIDVASLLDDADVAIRRKAAEVCFRLRAPATSPALKRTVGRDEDDEVRRWSALALARLGQPIAPLAEGLLRDPDRSWRRRAAMVYGERGDGRGCEELAAWSDEIAPAAGEGSASGQPPRVGLDLGQTEELLGALGKARCRTAVPALVRALADVRARPHVADALGAIGDDRALPALLTAFAAEPYVAALAHEGRALLALGASDWSTASPALEVDVSLAVPPRARSVRLLVLLSDAGATLEARVSGQLLAPGAASPEEVRSFDLAAPIAPRVRVELRVSRGGVLAAWLVPRVRLD